MNSIDKECLVASILNRELDMFLSVTADDIYTCQQSPDSFLLHRRAQFDAWDAPTLSSYLEDLMEAEREGVNLMTRKYAYMGGQLERPEDKPFLDTIVEYLYYWQCDMFKRYPALMRRARNLEEDSDEGTSFRTYLMSELCTYSDITLKHLHDYVSRLALDSGNLSEMIYENVLKANGFSSIAAYVERLG